jgi:Domain of Unknown Function with PDB structure (DUF3862)
MKKLLIIAGGIFGGFALLGVACMAFMGAAVDQADKEIKKELQTPGSAEGADSAGGDEKRIVTYEEYKKIKNGMSYDEVKKIIGQDGEEISNTSAGGFKTVMYQWMNADATNVEVMFQNGKVDTKSQFGLK